MGPISTRRILAPKKAGRLSRSRSGAAATKRKRQAEIMLSAENRDKPNVHHQSRNGTSAWYAAEVARLTQDAAWLASIAPALDENAEWTIAARRSTQNNKSPLTRGLLPAHIYGGDVRDPATSLYASMVCYKGLVETADDLSRSWARRK